MGTEWDCLVNCGDGEGHGVGSIVEWTLIVDCQLLCKCLSDIFAYFAPPRCCDISVIIRACETRWIR